MPLLGIVDGVVLPALPKAIVGSRSAFSCDSQIEILRPFFFPQRGLPKDPHGPQVRWEVHWPRLKPSLFVISNVCMSKLHGISLHTQDFDEPELTTEKQMRNLNP